MRSGRIRAAADEVLRAHGGVIVVRKPVAVVVVASVKSDRLDPQSASFIVLSRKREESNPLLASELNTASNLTAGGHGVLQKKRVYQNLRPQIYHRNTEKRMLKTSNKMLLRQTGSCSFNRNFVKTHKILDFSNSKSLMVILASVSKVF